MLYLPGSSLKRSVLLLPYPGLTLLDNHREGDMYVHIQVG